MLPLNSIFKRRFWLLCLALMIASCSSYHPLAEYNFNNGSTFINDSLDVKINFFGDISFNQLKKIDKKELSKTLKDVQGLKTRDLLLAGETNIPPLYKFYFFYVDEVDKNRKRPSKNSQLILVDSLNNKILIKKAIRNNNAYFLLQPKDASTQLKSLIRDGELLTERIKRPSDNKVDLKYSDIFSAYKDSYNYLKARSKIENAPINENDKNSWNKFQYLITVNSFIQNNKEYDSLLKKFENKRKGRIKSDLKSLIDAKKNITQDEKAIQQITNSAENTNVVMLNENHWYPKHRKLATELLRPLKEIGYEYLALEALYNKKDSLINTTRPYPIFSSGYYVREPFYANFIREAKALGFTLISYDDFSASNREMAQADNILNVLEKNKDAKIFVYAGLAHIEEEPEKTGEKRMASYLKDKGKIDPLTINQTELVGNFDPQILMFPADVIAEDSISQKHVDYFILNNYELVPSDQFKGEKLKDYRIDLSEHNSHSELLMLSIYFKNEYSKYKSYSIPFYNILTETKRDKFYNIRLPKGNYILKIHGETEDNITQKEIKVD